MPGRRVVVIGASAGGIGALREVLGGLPAGLPANVLIVVHMPPTSPGRLPDVLARCGPLPAAYAAPGQRLTPGLVTIAPTGQHLVLTAGDVLLCTVARRSAAPVPPSTRCCTAPPACAGTGRSP